jgi:hypothetical protein
MTHFGRQWLKVLVQLAKEDKQGVLSRKLIRLRGCCNFAQCSDDSENRTILSLVRLRFYIQVDTREQDFMVLQQL